MNCPICKKNEQHVEIEVHANGIDEDLIQCDICGSIWSVNHGQVEVVKDTQARSFLEATPDSVEGADYS